MDSSRAGLQLGLLRELRNPALPQRDLRMRVDGVHRLEVQLEGWGHPLARRVLDTCNHRGGRPVR